MRILAGLVALAALGAAAASAQTPRLTDTAYMQAARCVGLANSSTIASPDGKAMKAWLQAQSVGRAPYILDKGVELQRKAQREGDKADEFTKSRLSAEFGGVCAQLRG